MDGQGNLERTGKVRKKSGNLNINGCGRRSPENLFCSRGEKSVFSHKQIICSLGEQILSLRRNPQF